VILTPAGEPVAEPWTVRPLAAVVADLLALVGAPAGRPAVLAVDGRSGAGKSTFAAQVAAAVAPGAVVVHTDDVAWWESFFGWDHLMAAGILEPARRGEAVRFRPPAWDARGREGAIEVPHGTRLLVVEGDASSRRSLSHLLDGAVWVQSDAAEARRRGVERDGADCAAEEFWDEWDREEVPFFAADRPWERADLVLCGTPRLAAAPHDPAFEVLVGRALRA
jgi:hypothetical protein